MTHKARGKTEESLRYPPRCILLRPKLACLLGDVAAEWSLLESHLANLYALLMGTRIFKPRRTQSPKFISTEFHLDEVAIEIFDAIQPMRSRFDLLERIADLQLIKHPKQLAYLKTELIREIRTVGTQRNTLIHGLWGISDMYPDALILIPHNEDSDKLLVYEESDFNETIDRIIKANTAIGAFEDDLFGCLTT